MGMKTLTFLGHHVYRHRIDLNHVVHLLVDACSLEEEVPEQDVPREATVRHELADRLQLPGALTLTDSSLRLSWRIVLHFL